MARTCRSGTFARHSTGRSSGDERREVVVITGASAGLGRAIARRFAGPGVALGLIARDAARLEDACREARAAGSEALALPLDVADAAAVDRAADVVEQRLGPVDIWVNNAMVSVFAPVHETSAAEFHRVTAVTYLGVVHGTLAALRSMRPRGRGTIVQVGSALAYRGIPLQAAYCAAKHAVQGFCDSLRCELLHDGIDVRIAMVQMPALNTPQFEWSRSRMPRRARPVPPIYDPAVGAEAVFWAARSGRREVWVGWSTVLAVLGNRLAPWFADRYLARNGYDAQLTGEPEEPARCENLWSSCPGPYAARGRFGGVARHGSTQLWLSRHRWWLAGGAVLSAVLGALARGRTRGNGSGPVSASDSGAGTSARG